MYITIVLGNLIKYEFIFKYCIYIIMNTLFSSNNIILNIFNLDDNVWYWFSVPRYDLVFRVDFNVSPLTSYYWECYNDLDVFCWRGSVDIYFPINTGESIEFEFQLFSWEQVLFMRVFFPLLYIKFTTILFLFYYI